MSISPTTSSGSSPIARPRSSPNRTRHDQREPGTPVDRAEGSAFTDLGRLYGIEVVDFQIAGITYSESFRASVEAAVKAKNEAVAAENTVNRIRFEAQQAVARANGEAEAKLRIADADRQAAILNAQGNAEAIRLEGESRANVLRLNAEVLAPMLWLSNSSKPIGGTASCLRPCSTEPGSRRFSACRGRTIRVPSNERKRAPPSPAETPAAAVPHDRANPECL